MMGSVMAKAELGPGERAERARRRRLGWIVGALFAAGLVTGFLMARTEGPEGLLQAAMPTWLAVTLTGVYLSAVLIGSPLMLRHMDEHGRSEHLWFSAYGAGAFVIVYPAWFLLWKGRLVPEPHHLALFLTFYAGALIGYGVRFYRNSR